MTAVGEDVIASCLVVFNRCASDVRSSQCRFSA